MKVAMVSEHASPLAVLGGVDAGGQNVHVAALASALAKRRVEVVVYTRRDSPDQPERVPLTHGVTVAHVNAGPPEPLPKDELLPHMTQFGDELAAAWRRERPDLVHAHFWMSGWASLSAARSLEIPVVQTFHALGSVKRRHQGAADTSPARRLAIERELIARATGILATCRDEVTELRALGADPSRIRIVPCGVDLGIFRPDGEIAPRRAAQRIVAVTRLVERKGVSDVIEALHELPDAELLIAGGPPRSRIEQDAYAQCLLKQAESLGLADRVTLCGGLARDQVPALMRSADVVVCTPWYEPFGIVPLEAMACGVPVLGSAVGGLLDTIVDGVTGMHVPPRDPGALAASLRRLLADTPLRRSMGAAGAVRAHLGYGWDRIAGATLSAYRSLTQLSRSRETAQVGSYIPEIAARAVSAHTAL
jgi:D-inositol-3-phosphate glycosyltransferase